MPWIMRLNWYDSFSARPLVITVDDVPVRVVAERAGLDRVARAAVEGFGQRVRARGRAERAVADVALLVRHDLRGARFRVPVSATSV